MRTLLASVLAAVSAGVLIRAQQFPPGYVDPQPLLAAASKEIGEANLRCITFSGTGYSSPYAGYGSAYLGYGYPYAGYGGYGYGCNTAYIPYGWTWYRSTSC